MPVSELVNGTSKTHCWSPVPWLFCHRSIDYFCNKLSYFHFSSRSNDVTKRSWNFSELVVKPCTKPSRSATTSPSRSTRRPSRWPCPCRPSSLRFPKTGSLRRRHRRLDLPTTSARWTKPSTSEHFFIARVALTVWCRRPSCRWNSWFTRTAPSLLLIVFVQGFYEKCVSAPQGLFLTAPIFARAAKCCHEENLS